MGRLLALAAALALLAGCGGDDGDQSTASTPAPTGTATPAATATATEAAPTAPVAQGEGSADRGRFIFTITELKRSGPTVVLNATVTLAGGSENDSIQISDTFSDGIFQDLEDTGASEEGDVFDGVALIDPNGRKKYLVARESTGRCVCSNNLSAAFVGEDAPVNLQATLAAPPDTVTNVNVVVPNVRTFTGVPSLASLALVLAATPESSTSSCRSSTSTTRRRRSTTASAPPSRASR